MNEKNENPYSFFCWNIQNPSVERAVKQSQWLRKRPEQVFVLTETKASKGCLFLENYFRAYGYHVLFPKPEGKEYGVMIVSKIPFKESSSFQFTHPIQSRTTAVELSFPAGVIELIGTYVPSRDVSEEKISRKKTFLAAMSDAFAQSPRTPLRLFVGDLNILEPDHEPAYPFFQSWEYDFYENLKSQGLIDAFRSLHPNQTEYSWVGKRGDGYRYDHAFVSEGLHKQLTECFYVHEPRGAAMRLSDHSAIVTQISL